MKQVSIHIIGPFLPTSDGSSSGLVVTNWFMKLLKYTPCPNQVAETVASTDKIYYISRYISRHISSPVQKSL